MILGGPDMQQVMGGQTPMAARKPQALCANGAQTRRLCHFARNQADVRWFGKYGRLARG